MEWQLLPLTTTWYRNASIQSRRLKQASLCNMLRGSKVGISQRADKTHCRVVSRRTNVRNATLTGQKKNKIYFLLSYLLYFDSWIIERNKYLRLCICKTNKNTAILKMVGTGIRHFIYVSASSPLITFVCRKHRIRPIKRCGLWIRVFYQI